LDKIKPTSWHRGGIIPLRCTENTIIFPRFGVYYRNKGNAFILDETSDYIRLTNTTVIFGTNNDYSLKYLLAILNSKLLTFRYKSIGKQTGNGVFEYFANGIEKLPIFQVDKKTQDKISVLVDKTLELKQKKLPKKPAIKNNDNPVNPANSRRGQSD
jgi:hypothetical protein